MNWKNLAGKIQAVAPLLSGALAMTGPVGATAAKLVSAALGTPDGDEAAALRAVNDNPQLLLELKKTENDNAAILVEQFKAEAADRSDARKRELGFMAAHGGSRDVLQATLALAAAMGFLGAFFMLHHWPMVNGSRDILMVLVGVLAAINKDVYGYFFGSSRTPKPPS